MASAVSLEYLNSIKGQPDGLATLDNAGKIPTSQLPAGAVETYKGEFATTGDLTLAYPTGNLADYAYVTATLSYWYWNKALTTPAWVNQEIKDTDYNALSATAKASVPYVIVP